MQKIYRILPRYAFVPLICCILINAVTYFGTRIFTTGMYHYDFSIPLDDMIPFAPFMIIFYILAYVSWVVGFVIIGRESRQVCYEICTAEQLAKIMCLAAFLIIPSTIVRPEITGNGIFDWLTKFIYTIDSPDNLLPSIHCLENWICFRGAMRCKKVGTGFRIGMFISAMLVFASTLMVRQHVFLDVVSAVAVTEIGLFAVKKLNLERIYYNMEKRLDKKVR